MLKDDFSVLIKHLASLPKDKPWRTAEDLSYVFDKKYKSEEIEAALEDHVLTGGIDVRYSNLPERRTLAIQWAHVNNVGLRKLDSLRKKNIADDLFSNTSVDWPKCFISHSHKDLLLVKQLGELLIQYQISPWIAEVSIDQGEQIHQSIRKGLKEARYFILFLSRNTLTSVWARKEMENSLKHIKNPLIVINSTDTELIEYILQCRAYHSTCYQHSFQNLPFWKPSCNEFMQSLNEFLPIGKKLYSFPVLKHCVPALYNLEDFLMRSTGHRKKQKC